MKAVVVSSTWLSADKPLSAAFWADGRPGEEPSEYRERLEIQELERVARWHEERAALIREQIARRSDT